ncbi:P-loop NTPase fold protein [Acetobacterium malicum]|uniref:P-loop NTPase fold protein n=1 Tax=Acetobacterium malicum TaxID=52692 RepID=UPI003593B30B
MAEENILFVQRKGLIDELVEFNNNESNRICSLDGEWGSGKSFFIDKFINHEKCAVGDEEETKKIRNTDMNFDIIKFDAWENQGNENINMIFLEAIYEELNLREYEDL